MMILITRTAGSPPAVAGLSPPRQQRSERTLDRLLAAAEALLETRSFEELTVAELVAAGRTSVGAFYGRFEDKDALFEVLHNRFLGRWQADVAARARSRRWSHLSLERLVRDIVQFLAARFRAQRGVMRALAMHRRTTTSAGFAERMEVTSIAVHAFLVTAVLDKRSAITHPSADRAVAIGLGTIMTMLRDHFVIQLLRRRRDPADGVLEHELAGMLLSYLSGPRHPRGRTVRRHRVRTRAP